LPEAVTHIEHAAQLDPLSAQVHSTYGRILYRARKFDEAILRLNRAIELEPRNAQAYGRLGDVHDQIGKYVEALAFYEKSRALMANPGSSLRNRIARVYARMGREGCSLGSDRKSTRLNSSHVSISYAVFCLKK